ncbi:MAG: DNA cytosine methyltransferase [Nitrospira sp.]|nr:DNA cytosine methyltransferase [Nitrospira sp.]
MSKMEDESGSKHGGAGVGAASVRKIKRGVERNVKAAYYNECDPFCAQWLRNLISAGKIAPGDVDERSILDVRSSDLSGYAQCHFFAGIGGWSYALRLAGWPDSEPVWTGSCPCQPFSVAGNRKGVRDDRHLWPEWFRLIRQCAPPVVFGEQVEASIGSGWLDIVYNDLEGEGYSVGSAVLAAACVGAPHIRHRLWFVACSNERLLPQRGEQAHLLDIARTGEPGRMGNADGQGLEGSQRSGECQNKRAPRETGLDGVWRDAEWIQCRDGKLRAVEPGTFPLANGVPARMGRLRAYGNAIVPQVAAKFISVCTEAFIR